VIDAFAVCDGFSKLLKILQPRAAARISVARDPGIYFGRQKLYSDCSDLILAWFGKGDSWGEQEQESRI
jgi:hypothetical protein